MSESARPAPNLADPGRRAFLLRRPAAGREAPNARAAAPAGALTVTAACLARQGVECRLCAEVCAPRALRFVPARGGVALVQLDTAACTGCGECQPLCPVGALQPSTRWPAPSADPTR